MTEAARRAIEADVRLPQRRWRPQASWPVLLASLLLHLALAAVLYPGGGAPPPAPAPLFTVDVVLRAPGAPALPEGVNAGAPAPPATADAAAPATAAIARSAPTAVSQALATVAAAAPTANTATAPTASIALAAQAPAPTPSPLTALKAQTAASTPTPTTAATAPAAAASSLTVSAITTAAAAAAAAPSSATAAAPPLTAAAVVEAAAAPAPNIASAGQQSASFVAQAATPSAVRIAPSVGPPPSVQAGAAPVLAPDTVRTLQAARPTFPPPPLPPRKPPSLLARERNPRIVRENARIVGAPLPLVEDMPPAGALAVGRALDVEAVRSTDSRAADTRGRRAARPASSARTGNQGRSGRQGGAGIATPADYRGAGFWNPPPPYPFQARRRGLEGQVIVRVEVTPAGRAKSVAVRRSSGHRVLDRAALAAVREWRFKPAARGGKPVSGAVDVPVTFRLNQ